MMSDDSTGNSAHTKRLFRETLSDTPIHADTDDESKESDTDDYIIAVHCLRKKHVTVFNDDDDSSSVDTIDLTTPIFNTSKKPPLHSNEIKNKQKNDFTKTNENQQIVLVGVDDDDDDDDNSACDSARRQMTRPEEHDSDEFVLPQADSKDSSDDDLENEQHQEPSYLHSKPSVSNVNPYSHPQRMVRNEHASTDHQQSRTTKLAPVPYAYYTQEQFQPPMNSTLSLSSSNRIDSTKKRETTTTTILYDPNDSDMDRLGEAAFGFDTKHQDDDANDTMKPQPSLRQYSNGPGTSETNNNKSIVDLCHDGTPDNNDEDASYHHPWDYDESMVVRMGLHRDSQSPYLPPHPPTQKSRSTVYDEEIEETFSDEEDDVVVDYKRTAFGRVASSYIERRRRNGTSLEPDSKIYSNQSSYSCTSNDLSTATRTTTQPRRIRDYRASNVFFGSAVVTRNATAKQQTPPYWNSTTETIIPEAQASTDNTFTNNDNTRVVRHTTDDTTDWNAELAAVRAFGSLHRNDIIGGSGVGAGSYQITHMDDNHNNNSYNSNGETINNKENDDSSSRWNQSFVSQPSRQRRSNTNHATTNNNQKKKKRAWGRKRGMGRGRGSSRSSSNRRQAAGSRRNQSTSSWAGNTDDPNLQHIGGAEMSF